VTTTNLVSGTSSSHSNYVTARDGSCSMEETMQQMSRRVLSTNAAAAREERKHSTKFSKEHTWFWSEVRKVQIVKEEMI
jgi:hypothetical protein